MSRFREYGKVSCSWWHGDLGRQLRGDHFLQALASYLMTSPHSNLAGLYSLPLGYLAQDLGSPFEGASEGLAKLQEMGFLEYDFEREIVWVRELARHELGENLKREDKRHTAVVAVLHEHRKSFVVRQFHLRYAKSFQLPEPSSDTPLEAPPKGLTKPLAMPLGKPSSSSYTSTYPCTTTECAETGTAEADASELDEEDSSRAGRRVEERGRMRKAQEKLEQLIPDFPDLLAAWRDTRAGGLPTVAARRRQFEAALVAIDEVGTEAVRADIERTVRAGWKAIHLRSLERASSPANGHGHAGRPKRLQADIGFFDPEDLKQQVVL